MDAKNQLNEVFSVATARVLLPQKGTPDSHLKTRRAAAG
jgi:hypothetical protein